MKKIIHTKTYATGSKLVLQLTTDTWAGVGEMTVFEVFYADKAEEGFNVCQTEFFSSKDIDGSEEAFFARIRDGKPESSYHATGRGRSLEYIKEIDAIVDGWLEINANDIVVKKLHSEPPVGVISKQQVLDRIQNNITLYEDCFYSLADSNRKKCVVYCDDYLFFYRVNKTMRAKSSGCAFQLPMNVGPRPELEDGVIRTLEEHNNIFNNGVKILYSNYALATLLKDNDLI